MQKSVSFVHEGITNNLMLHFRLPEKNMLCNLIAARSNNCRTLLKATYQAVNPMFGHSGEQNEKFTMFSRNNCEDVDEPWQHTAHHKQ